MSDITDRLRCRYVRGPIMPDGEPEFGWRDMSGPAPEGMMLPTPLMLEAAAFIDAQAAEIAEAKGQIEHLDRQNNTLREALAIVAEPGWLHDALQSGDATRLARDVAAIKRRARAALSQGEPHASDPTTHG